ncbi:MAG: MFS transporter [Akkermansiaceae bacterium]
MSVIHESAKSSIPENEKVPLRTKAAWGCGGLADNFMFNILMMLGMLIYVDHFRLSPTLAGFALFVPRFVDAITDPWIGNYSDNFKSKWGRRKPFIFVGVLLSAIILPFLWTPVMLETVGNPWYSNGPFLYLSVVGSLLAVSYTLFVVPYTALGFELTPNYDERTRTIAWRMYIGLLASVAGGWLYWLCQREVFADEGQGAVWVSAGAAVLVLIFGWMPVFFCKETVEIESQPPIKLFDAVRFSFTNKPFMILMVAYLVVIMSIFVTSGVFPFLIIYGVFEGNKGNFGEFQGYMITMGSAISYVSMWVITAISLRSSKRWAMLVGLGFIFLGMLTYWFAIDPRWPWMMYVAAFVSFMGMQGCWLMVDSMVADVCDADELRTGLRREGMFGAVKGFALKLAQAITSAVGGYMIALAGFDPDVANDTGVPEDVIFNMKAMVVGVTCIGLVVAAIVMWFYPISREAAVRTQEALAKKRDENDVT